MVSVKCSLSNTLVYKQTTEFSVHIEFIEVLCNVWCQFPNSNESVLISLVLSSASITLFHSCIFGIVSSVCID